MTLRTDVAALYVDPRGPYPKLVEHWWDEERDARTYAGPLPVVLGDGEWTCEVWQSAYGHRARKRTWLFYAGTRDPINANWLRHPGTHQVGWFDRIKPTLSKKEAKETPVAFAEWLLELAAGARKTVAHD